MSSAGLDSLGPLPENRLLLSSNLFGADATIAAPLRAAVPSVFSQKIVLAISAITGAEAEAPRLMP